MRGLGDRARVTYAFKDERDDDAYCYDTYNLRQFHFEMTVQDLIYDLMKSNIDMKIYCNRLVRDSFSG